MDSKDEEKMTNEVKESVNNDVSKEDEINKTVQVEKSENERLRR